MAGFKCGNLIDYMRISTFGSDRNTPGIVSKRMKKPYMETTQSCITPWRWRSQGERHSER